MGEGKDKKGKSKKEQIERFNRIYEKIKNGEIKLTKRQIGAIHRGLKLLARKDPDKASVRNRQGFGAVDTMLGHSLANRSELSYEEAIKGLELVFRYRGQLPSGLKKEIFSPRTYQNQKHQNGFRTSGETSGEKFQKRFQGQRKRKKWKNIDSDKKKDE